MRRSIGRLSLFTLVAVLCALPSPALALGDEPAERDGAPWAPALAAWGALAAGSADRAPNAPALGEGAPEGEAARGLVAVGQGSAETAADAALRTREPGERDETERWVPSLGLHSALFGQGASASISSDSSITYDMKVEELNTGAGVFGAAQTLRVTRFLTESKNNVIAGTVSAPVFYPNTVAVHAILGRVTVPPVLPASDSGLMLNPSSGSSLELMTPGLQALPGRPRLFVRGGAATAFSFERNVAKEGKPGAILYPLAPGNGVYVSFENEVNGTGSATQAKVETLVLSAGMGPVFTLDAFERRLRLKASLEWVREEMKLSGSMIRVFRKWTGRRAPSGVPQTDTTVFFLPPLDITASKTQTFDGIGPGLELEMDTGRAGPVVLSLFASAKAYRMLGELGIHFEGTKEISDPALVPQTQTASAEWDFELDPWTYQGGIGLRLRWVPED